MRVNELIDKLSECNPYDMVVRARDAEGNGFAPLGDFGREGYIADNAWSCL